jgi:hypothetical protein
MPTPGSDPDAVFSLFTGFMICLPRSGRFPAI